MPVRSISDDIRNGMALCKLCHWAFDEGMMGVSDNYEVITSRQIAADPIAISGQPSHSYPEK